MSSKTLCERCRNSTNFKEDTFVGVNCSDGDISVNFPLGFHIQPVIDAFMRIYGIDIKKAGALSTVYLDVERIG